MILHCLSCDAYAPAVDDMLAWATTGDTVLLLGHACNMARPGHPRLAELVASGVRLHALDDDLALHGIDTPDERVRSVDFSDWVTLASDCGQQMNWR